VVNPNFNKTNQTMVIIVVISMKYIENIMVDS
jgi:hypothetical protein